MILTLPVWLICRFQQSLQTLKKKQKENHFISTSCMAGWKFMSVTLFNHSVGKIVCWWCKSSLFFPLQGLFFSLQRRCLLLLILWIKGIFWHKFNPWSHIPWHGVRPPLERSSFPTASLHSFSNLRKDCTITTHCSICLQPRNRHHKASHSHK